MARGMLLQRSVTTMLPGDLAAPSWTIRPEQALDLDQIHELYRGAFPGATEAELVDAIRATAHFIPELSLVSVTADGTILGHVLLSQIAFADPGADAPIEVLALAPIAVLAPHRGRGIGTALVTEALAVADARPEPFSVVVGSAAFFGRFGYRPASDVGVTGPYDVAGDAFAVRPRRGLVVPPGTVSYPPAFPAL